MHWGFILLRIALEMLFDFIHSCIHMKCYVQTIYWTRDWSQCWGNACRFLIPNAHSQHAIAQHIRRMFRHINHKVYHLYFWWLHPSRSGRSITLCTQHGTLNMKWILISLNGCTKHPQSVTNDKLLRVHTWSIILHDFNVGINSKTWRTLLELLLAAFGV